MTYFELDIKLTETIDSNSIIWLTPSTSLLSKLSTSSQWSRYFSRNLWILLWSLMFMSLRLRCSTQNRHAYWTSRGTYSSTLPFSTSLIVVPGLPSSHISCLRYFDIIVRQFSSKCWCANFSSTQNCISEHLVWSSKKSWKDGCSNLMRLSCVSGTSSTDRRESKVGVICEISIASSRASAVVVSWSKRTIMEPTIRWNRIIILSLFCNPQCLIGWLMICKYILSSSSVDDLPDTLPLRTSESWRSGDSHLSSMNRHVVET